MRITKKKILSLIKENIEEMAMDFDSPDRPNPQIMKALETGDTPFKKVPFPKTGNPNQNFQEKLASERYKEVIRNVRKYTGLHDIFAGTTNSEMTGMMMNAHNKIIDMESQYKDELTKLGIEIVEEYMGIDKNTFNYKIYFGNQERIPIKDFIVDKPNDKNPEEVNIDDTEKNQEIERMGEEMYQNLKNLDLERAKQRLINSIIQGAAKKGHYLYQMVGKKLKELTGTNALFNLYGVMMAINDANYWQWGNNTVSNLGTAMAGKVSVDFPKDTDDEGYEGDGDEGDDDGGQDNGYDPSKPTITVYAVNFPVLIHELLKGVWLVLSTHGQSEDRETYEKVKEYENTFQKEAWDLRLGPAIWTRVWNSIPEKVLLDNDKKLQNYLFMNIFQLPAKEFLVLMREVISNSDKGKRMLDSMVESIEQMFKNEEYEQALNQFQDELDDATDETDDDDLEDFLGGLGINLPDEE